MIFCLWYLSANFNRVWVCTLFNSFSWIFPYAKQQHNFQRKPIETNCFLYTSDDYQCKIDEPEERKIGKFVTGSSFLIRSVKYQYVLDGDNISVATYTFVMSIYMYIYVQSQYIHVKFLSDVRTNLLIIKYKLRETKKKVHANKFASLGSSGYTTYIYTDKWNLFMRCLQFTKDKSW